MECSIKGCDREDIVGWNMCGRHYRRWKRGRLDEPAYKRGTGSIGMTTRWPFEFFKDDGVWYRRPSQSNHDWEVVPGFKDRG